MAGGKITFYILDLFLLYQKFKEKQRNNTKKGGISKFVTSKPASVSDHVIGNFDLQFS